MSGLRSALEELSSEDLSTLGDAAVEDGFAELVLAARAIEAERLRWLREIDRRGTWAADGFLSTASWVKARFHEAGGDAASDVRTARALEDMPEAQAALEEGEISRSGVAALVRAREHAPEAFAASAPLLVEAARSLTFRDLGRALGRWEELAAADGSLDRANARWERRGLHVSPTVFGMVRVDGTLDPENGEIVLTALRAEMDAQVKSGCVDSRTAAQRRADAFGEICRRDLDRPGRPEVGGERPHISVLVDLETLIGGDGHSAGGRVDDASAFLRALERRCGAELETVGPIPAETARRIACDASVTRIVLGARSQPLDVGRRTPVVPPAIRRALVVRDRGCAVPGCDRPPQWCDAHHVRHWARGGPTSLANTVLLCRRHHRIVHDHGLTVEIRDEFPVFRRPDGSVIDERRPP